LLGDYKNRPADPFNAYEPVDSSAAAIDAQGLLRLGTYLKAKGQSASGERYFEAGLRVAQTLFSEPYLASDPKHHGLILHSIYHQPNGWDYRPDPAKAAKVGFETPDGLYFNKHFPNVNIAMPAPLSDDQLTYADGTKATTAQMAKDVAAFLTWTAEPSLVERRQTGWFVLGFLLFATTLAFLSYKQIWAGLKPKKK
jgi:hypothetical protein